jgi:hypothetical protein
MTLQAREQPDVQKIVINGLFVWHGALAGAKMFAAGSEGAEPAAEYANSGTGCGGCDELA